MFKALGDRLPLRDGDHEIFYATREQQGFSDPFVKEYISDPGINELSISS